MKTSQAGLKLIKSFEGCRLTAYMDSAGIWTIGYGHTSGVKPGMTITQVKADNYLIKDLSSAESKVEKYNNIYNFSQPEFDALVSFAFNIGNIDQLTDKGRRDKHTIAEKMLQYNKAGGRVLAGLTKRREAERQMFVLGALSQMPKEEDIETGYYLRYIGNSKSIVTALKSLGIDSSMKNRKAIASKNSIMGYTGTADQNTKMLSLLKEGKLKR